MKHNFSVLMSLYIKESPIFLSKCLESLSFQTIKASEVVVVIDGPITDELHAEINFWKTELNIKTFPIEINVGLGEALNYGLKKCNFNIVARMDTDDICLPNRFEKQLSYFSSNPNVSICGSAIEEIEPFTLKKIAIRTVPLSNDNILDMLPRRNPFNHMTVMYRKDHIIKVGGYKHLPWMEDWYLWSRLLTAGYLGANLPDITVKARTGSAMLTRRSGMSYIKSEWLISQIMYKFGLVGIHHSFFIFLARSFPRILPKKLIKKIYSLSR